MTDQTAARATAIINMLASDNDGEALNAARILASKARDRGLLMADYLRTLLIALDARSAAPQPAPAAPDAAPQRDPDAGRPYLSNVIREHMVAWRDGGIGTAWERDFMTSVLRANRALTERQYVSYRRMLNAYGVPAPVDPVAAHDADVRAYHARRDAAVAERERVLRERANGRRDYAAEARATARANGPKPGDPCPF